MQADTGEVGHTIALVGLMNSFAFDYIARSAVGAMTLGWYIWESLPLPPRGCAEHLIGPCLRLSAASVAMAPAWVEVSRTRPWRSLWAVTPHERLRIRCMLDATVAMLYGLDRDSFAWILKDCDHPVAHLSHKVFARQLDPKGFWRVGKTEDPELRHTVLSLAAFDDLVVAVRMAGNRDEGINDFYRQNNGDGWMLPETLCLAELGLTRTASVGEFDERALAAQPVRSRMGERFLDWQDTQAPEESWAECEQHAKSLREGVPAPVTEISASRGRVSEALQVPLFESED